MSGRAIDENDCIICGKDCVSLFFCEECEEEKQWEEKCDTLQRQLEEAREENERLKSIITDMIKSCRHHKLNMTADEIEKQLKEKGDEV
jgi:hypothetical protein